MLKIVLVGVVLGALSLLAYIRFAASDPARWHIDIAAADFTPPANWAAFCPGTSARDGVDFGAGDPLATFAAVVDATPRTTRLAGSVAAGRITWITRSQIFGFPDYATAALIETADGPQVCVVSRQRFGSEDGGVNARRLESWLMASHGFQEPPRLGWRVEPTS